MNYKKLLAVLISTALLSSCAATKDMSCGSSWLLMGPLAIINCNQADGDPFTKIASIPENHSVIYIYRPFSSISGASEPDVYVNGKLYGELDNRGYFPIITNESEVTIRIDKEGFLNNWDVPGKTITLKPNPGDSYYLRVEAILLSMSFIGTTAVAQKELRLSVLNEENAIEDIKDTKLIKVNL